MNDSDDSIILEFSSKLGSFEENCKQVLRITTLWPEAKAQTARDFDFDAAYKKFSAWLIELASSNDTENTGFISDRSLYFDIGDGDIMACSCPEWSEDDADWSMDIRSQSSMDNSSIVQAMRSLAAIDNNLRESDIFACLVLIAFCHHFGCDNFSEASKYLLSQGRDRVYFCIGVHSSSLFTIGLLDKNGYETMNVNH
ncbi:hypothetical protein [Leptospira alstonii]|uniref:Uncharacterized protein n=2 Tax=Leptospira alstonii TaxID=28452 RepID=M6DCN3_9LEPT|nr:hypothetical protein [Leptospira alstonii]EMJ96330.1 hypothetical protein LEP1GSC194_3264 [Leptospira alstonii serovar Sichuan str. 79601]EQA81678.1 hypothetical protein LEP1GSC193_2900 [Leptospira alstonii serovar Pingchang str. 80-412]